MLAVTVDYSANAVAALALTLLVRGQVPHRGWRLWQFALWASTAGIALMALAGSRPWVLSLGLLLSRLVFTRQGDAFLA